MHKFSPVLMIGYFDTGLDVELHSAMESNGFEVMMRTSPDGFVSIARGLNISALLLVCKTPDALQLDLIKNLRKAGYSGALMVWCGESAGESYMETLRVGADDCFAGIMDMQECAMKVKRLLKLRFQNQQISRIMFGSSWIDFNSYEASGPGGTVTLNNKEMQIMKLLIQNQGEMVSRKEMMMAVWNIYGSGLRSRSMDTYIYMLRQKFENNPSTPKHIITLPGRGYMFQTGSHAEQPVSTNPIQG